MQLEEEGTEEQIGYSLKNINEAGFVTPVVELLSRIIELVGINQPDEAYYNSPLWDELVEASKKAYELLSKNDTEAAK